MQDVDLNLSLCEQQVQEGTARMAKEFGDWERMIRAHTPVPEKWQQDNLQHLAGKVLLLAKGSSAARISAQPTERAF